jgi:hypothetical protein
MYNRGVQRRDVLKTAAALAATAVVTDGLAAPPSRMVGIQMEVGPIHDRGPGPVLDDIQTRGRVNTVFLGVFTYTDTRAGIVKPGFHGGNFATVHQQYYKDVPVSPAAMRAPDLGSYDVLAAMIPEAQKRRMKTFCWVIEDNFRPAFPGFEQMWERDLYGNIPNRHPAQGCLNNPGYRNFVLGLMEDYARSYAIDGVMWGAERQGPLGNSLGAFHNGSHSDPGKVTCFCGYCQAKAKQQGISVERAKQGYMALEKFVRAGRGGTRPRDGYFVTFWRILLEYPEILAWEMLWTRSMREHYAAIYERVKSVRPEVQVGCHIWHNISFSPFYRAEQDYTELARYSDYIKPVLYNNCAGDRMITYMDSVGQNVFGDVPKPDLLAFQYDVLDYREAALDRLRDVGLSADYVYRETKRAVDGMAGTRVAIWPGIDIDVPTPRARCTPESVRAAVEAALRAGAPGVLLSRAYLEMKPENLSAAGQALA